MKLVEVLSRATELTKHLKTKRKRRLHTQWVEMAGLLPEAVPQNNGMNSTVKIERTIAINAPVEKVFSLFYYKHTSKIGLELH